MNKQDKPIASPQSIWRYINIGAWRTPLGIFGVVLTTTTIALIILGVVVDQLGIIRNPYVGVVTYLVLPMFMITGLLILPLAAFLQRRKYRKSGKEVTPLRIDFGNPRHQMTVLLLVFLTIINMGVFLIVGYEGYHFTDSKYFCGKVCHVVMKPEFTAYSRSPHSRVACVDCHIGSGADWYVKAKISGLRQVISMFTGSYSRPIKAPVENLRPARDTCEECHWPEKFHGKKVKRFTTFTNENQEKPEIQEVSLHIGGRNPSTGQFEGIHWHVGSDVEVSYEPENEQRTKIGTVRVKRNDGTIDEFNPSEGEKPEVAKREFRIMDCIDCHNRPTHIYYMPEEVVDFGLLTGKINGKISGIREDSLAAITKKYASQAEAKTGIIETLLRLQKARGEQQIAAYKSDLEKAGTYLVNSYCENVWPDMKIDWGTYKSHLGHKYEAEGFGCFRCHDDEHATKEGKVISQECSYCHDDPY